MSVGSRAAGRGYPEFLRPLPAGCPVVISQAFAADNEFEPYGCLMSAREIGYAAGSVGTWGHWHNGVDYAVPMMTPLVAPHKGKVIAAGISESGFGLRLLVKSGRWWWLLGHCSDLKYYLNEWVDKGEVVAYSGGANGDERDGNSTGAHVHFSVLADNLHYYAPWLFVRG